MAADIQPPFIFFEIRTIAEKGRQVPRIPAKQLPEPPLWRLEADLKIKAGLHLSKKDVEYLMTAFLIYAAHVC